MAVLTPFILFFTALKLPEAHTLPRAWCCQSFWPFSISPISLVGAEENFIYKSKRILAYHHLSNIPLSSQTAFSRNFQSCLSRHNLYHNITYHILKVKDLTQQCWNGIEGILSPAPQLGGIWKYRDILGWFTGWYYWHLVDRSQGCCWTPYKGQKELPSPKYQLCQRWKLLV